MRISATSDVAAHPKLNFFTRYRWVWIILCYLALSAIFFWPSIWSGAVPLPLTNPYLIDPVWSPVPPPGVAAGGNVLLNDVSTFYYPYLVFTINSLRQGIFPLWNPYIFGGTPYFASNQAALLYPINVICYMFGPQQFWVVAATLRLLIAGCGMYLFMRRLGTGSLGALLSGAIYMFGSFSIVWLNFAVHNVVALLPLTLWLILRIIERPSRWTILALIGIVAAQMFGGHPETSLFFLLTCACFTAVWLVGKANWKRAGLSVIAAVILGLGLTAVQWIPTLDLVFRSIRVELIDANQNLPASEQFSPLGGMKQAKLGNLRYWLLSVAPEMWGTPRGTQDREWLPPRVTRYGGNYNELASYIGLATLPLVAAGALRGGNRRGSIFFGAMFVVCLLLLYPLPGVYRIGYLPVLKLSYGLRFGFGMLLAGAALAGFGLEWLRTAGSRSRWLVVLGLAFLVAINVAITAILWNGQHLRLLLGFDPTDTQRTFIATIYSPNNWRIFLPATTGIIAIVALVATMQKWLTFRVAGLLIMGAILTDLIGIGFGYNGFTEPQDIYPARGAVAELLRDSAQYRVLNLDNSFTSNSGMTHGIQTMNGNDDLLNSPQWWFVARGEDGIIPDPVKYRLNIHAQRLVDLMNVRYIFSTRPVICDTPQASCALAEKGGNLLIQYNRTAFPRAYAMSRYIEVKREEAEDMVYAPLFDPRYAVVVEEPLKGQMRSDPVGSLIPVKIVSYTPNRVELAPNMLYTSVVVLGDTYDPDWQVTIDGQPAKLLRANSVFRGVVVPAGPHSVVFSYRPRSVLYGGAVSGVVLLGCVAIALVRIRRRTR